MINRFLKFTMTVALGWLTSQSVFSVEITTPELLDGSVWKLAERGEYCGDSQFSFSNYRKDVAMFDLCLYFGKGPIYSNVDSEKEELKLTLLCNDQVHKTTNPESLKEWNNIAIKHSDALDKIIDRINNMRSGNIVTLEDGNILNFDDGKKIKFNVEDERLTIDFIRSEGDVCFNENNGTKKLKFSNTSVNGKNINGLWDLGSVKILASDYNALPEYLKTTQSAIKFSEADKKGLTYMYMVDANTNIVFPMPIPCKVEKDRLILITNYVVILSYALSNDGKTLQLCLPKMQRTTPPSHFDPMHLTSQDSIRVLDEYGFFKKDALLQSELVQQNKMGFLRVVNQCSMPLWNSHQKYVEKTGTTGTAYKDSAIAFAREFIKSINSLMAFNCALDDRFTADMAQFVPKAKRVYVRETLKNYALGADIKNDYGTISYSSTSEKYRRNDSISYAKGYNDGLQLAKSANFKVDEYDLLKGLEWGYLMTKNDREGAIKIDYPVEKESASFKLGFNLCNGKKIVYESYLSGVFYGCMGKKSQWSEKGMMDFLKKYSK